MYDISIYGMGNHKIQHDLSDLSANTPTWNDLIPLREVVAGLPDYVLLSREIRDSHGLSRMPAYQWDVLLSTGSYGKVFKGFRIVYKRQHTATAATATATECYMLDTEAEAIVLKEISIENNQNACEPVLYEATIHAIVVQCFNRVGWPFAVPTLHEVFLREGQELAIVFCMEYIRGSTLYDFLKENFKRFPCKENNTIYLRILAEVALQLLIIQRNLRMNHRDMKVNNILVRRRKPEWISVFAKFYPALAAFDKFQFNVVLIDYGFACISRCESSETLLEAGNWFDKSDICCKMGRDMAQFIYCMECYFPSRKYLTPKLGGLIRDWMKINYAGGLANLINGFHADGKPRSSPPSNGSILFDVGIYEFLRKPEVDPIHCAPAAILENIRDFIASA